MMKIGDNVIAYNNLFRFFMTTKLSNPHYPPEVQVKVSLLNFTITQQGKKNSSVILFFCTFPLFLPFYFTISHFCHCCCLSLSHSPSLYLYLSHPLLPSPTPKSPHTLPISHTHTPPSLSPTHPPPLSHSHSLSHTLASLRIGGTTTGCGSGRGAPRIE